MSSNIQSGVGGYQTGWRVQVKISNQIFNISNKLMDMEEE